MMERARQITKGVYRIGSNAPQWYIPDVASSGPWIYGDAQFLGFFDCEGGAPSQSEMKRIIAPTLSPGGSVLRIATPARSDAAHLFYAEQQSWPQGCSLRLWVGGCDYWHFLDNKYPVNQSPYGNQAAGPGQIPVLPSLINGNPRRTPYTELKNFFRSTNAGGADLDTFPDSKSQMAFEQCMTQTNVYDLSSIAQSTSGPIEIDLSALAGGCRYVWACLDFVALPPPRYQFSSDVADYYEPRDYWRDPGTIYDASPQFACPWTVHCGPGRLDTMPSEVRIADVPKALGFIETYDPYTVNEFMNPVEAYLADSNPSFPRWAVTFTARHNRARRRLNCYSNDLRNRGQWFQTGGMYAQIFHQSMSWISSFAAPQLGTPISSFARPLIAAAQHQPPLAQWSPVHYSDALDASSLGGSAGQTGNITVAPFLIETPQRRPNPEAPPVGPGDCGARYDQRSCAIIVLGE